MTNTAIPTLTGDDIADLKARVDAGEIRLTEGHHDPTKGEACAMDLIVWRATGEIADHHECVHRVISGHIHYLNDREGATQESRMEIVENAGAAILGTAGFTMYEALMAVFAAIDGAKIAANIAQIRTSAASKIVGARISGGGRAPAATSGYGAPAATSGYGAPAATSGDWAPAATSGDRAPAATSGGRAPAATSGYGAPAATSGGRAPAATSGDGAPAATSGVDSIAASLAGGMVHTGPNGALVATWNDGTRHRVVVGYAGEDGIEAGVWYRLDAVGKFEQVPEDLWPVIPGWNAPAASLS